MTIDLEHTSSSAAGLRATCETMRVYGQDPQDLLDHCGLTQADIDRPGTRIASRTHLAGIQFAFDRCGDPAFGLRASDYILPTSYHAWGLSLLSSSTLRSYLKRWVRFYSLIATHAEINFDEDAVGARLTYRFLGPVNQFAGALRAMSDANMAVAIRYIRIRYHSGYQPLRVELPHPCTESLEPTYRAYLGENITFDAGRTALTVASSELDVKLPAANSELARQNDEMLVRHLAKVETADISTRVRARIIEFLPSGDCDKTRVAESMFMSPRTLQNRLTEAGTTFRALFDQTRRELAGQYMRQSDKPTIEVAYLLGFSDYSSFSRAFARWMGCSPSEYRKRHG